MQPLALVHQGEELEGYVAWPEGEGPFPAVLVFHSGMGLKEFDRGKALALAREGYVGICADMYGKGRHKVEIGDFAPSERISSTPGLMRSRVTAWYDAVAALAGVDSSRIAAFGFCMGGSCVLELARSGRDVRAVVSYHGVLTTGEPARKGAVKAVVAAYCGLEDPFAPPETIAGLRAELSAAEADYHVVEFAKVGHSFTFPEAASYGMPGIAYDAVTDAVSWAGTLALFDAVLRGYP